MNFQAQPYPLFAVRIFNHAVERARIIGWSVPDHRDPCELVPVALFDEDDGTVTEPRSLNLDDDRYWISKDQAWAIDRAIDELAKREANR